MTTTTFAYTGKAQTWVIPLGVTSITMQLAGGGGGNQPGGGGQPGTSGYLRGTYAVTPGHTLTLKIGGKGNQGKTTTYGAPPGGFPNGGAGGNADFPASGRVSGSGGGGATKITDTTSNTTLCIAGGGGASGYGGGGAGGNGGGTGAQSGSVAGKSGKGASQTAGGAAGQGAFTDMTQATQGFANAGGNGSAYSGGGGGDGYYGGGGGGSDSTTRSYGGGGGSSYVGAGTAVTNTQGGGTTGNGSAIFTYNLPPNAPSLSAPSNQTTIDVTKATTFQWINSFVEAGDSQTAFDMQYRVVGASAWTQVGKTTQPGVQTTIAANTFVTGNQYEWQIRTYGAKAGTAGAWSSSSIFNAASPPAAVSIVHPAAGEIVAASQYIVTWQSVPAQQAYQVQILGDDGNGNADPTQVIYDTGYVGDERGSNNTIPVVFPAGDYQYHLLITVRVSGVLSPTTNYVGTTAIEAPQPPLCTATGDNTRAAIVIAITNPTTDTSVPPAVYNNVYRSDPTHAEIRVATGVPLNGTWTDYTPASGVPYTYRVTAVASTGAETP